MARRAAKIDGNHGEIVAALRKAECSVVSLAKVGNGCPDLLVGRLVDGFRENFLLEVKDPSKPPSHRKLTPAQEQFFAEWNGQRAKVETVEQALRAVGL